MKWWIIGITCFSLLGNSILLVESTPVVSPGFGGLASFESNHREQRAEFGEGIRDWFRNLKNRLFGRSGDDQENLPPSEAGKMMLELEDKDIRDRKDNYPGGFFLDLSNLSFNPETDWGFRLGQWYFIKKSRDPSSDDWKLFQPDNTEWPTSNENTDHIMEPSLITRKPGNDVTTLEPSTLSEKTTQVSNKKDEDNETRNPSDNNRSTEVLLPSE